MGGIVWLRSIFQRLHGLRRPGGIYFFREA